ncbi:MAG: hypothetical protein DME65_06100 [Verrucomicrobia bacterium]|nr:MAG: hypothetical protein DME65_06100 [Verrucomicrobiota bacterium]
MIRKLHSDRACAEPVAATAGRAEHLDYNRKIIQSKVCPQITPVNTNTNAVGSTAYEVARSLQRLPNASV